MYHSGYNKVCSSHSGVSIILNHKFICPKSIHSYWIPSEHKLQGRILGIRIRGERYDTMHITIYYPPYTTDYSNQLCAQICKSVEKCIQELPNRCMPVLYFDGNSSLGQLRTKVGTVDVNSNVCGPHGIGVENPNGTLIRQMLERNGIYIPATYYETEYTYIS